MKVNSVKGHVMFGGWLSEPVGGRLTTLAGLDSRRLKYGMRWGSQVRHSNCSHSQLPAIERG
jgi:hypothetical protein